jgi:hypothetical protein
MQQRNSGNAQIIYEARSKKGRYRIMKRDGGKSSEMM